MHRLEEGSLETYFDTVTASLMQVEQAQFSDLLITLSC
jgi:hypothetical protein